MPTSRNQQAKRAIDANWNRLSEALRVIEDCLRFAMGAVASNAPLAKNCKELRHELNTWVQQSGFSNAALWRDIKNDSGRGQDTTSEYVRSGTSELLAANFSRARQSARSLEEFSKLFDTAASQQMERMRYRIYELEKQTLVAASSHHQLNQAHLYALVDVPSDKETFCQSLLSLIRGGVDVIQLRAPSLPDKPLIDAAYQLSEICREHRVVSIINNRPDIAAICQVDGVHLGQDDMSVCQAREIVGGDALVGVSSHSISQARQAVSDGANYIGVGPIFPSQTKSFADFPGTKLLRLVATEIRLPAFAIGGINATNLSQVLDCGIARVAVSHALTGATTIEVENASRRLKAILGSATRH